MTQKIDQKVFVNEILATNPIGLKMLQNEQGKELEEALLNAFTKEKELEEALVTSFIEEHAPNRQELEITIKGYAPMFKREQFPPSKCQTNMSESYTIKHPEQNVWCQKSEKEYKIVPYGNCHIIDGVLPLYDPQYETCAGSIITEVVKIK
jgi:hypothetical protein